MKSIEYPVVVLANIPPDIDPLADSIDKTSVREALRALLQVALPLTKVHILTNPSGGIEAFCRAFVGMHMVAEVDSLSFHEVDDLVSILATGCHFVIIGGGMTDLVSIQYAVNSQSAAGRGKERFKLHPIASTGGLAEKVYHVRSEQQRKAGEEPNAALLDDLVYDSLFRDILGLSA